VVALMMMKKQKSIRRCSTCNVAGLIARRPALRAGSLFYGQTNALVRMKSFLMRRAAVAMAPHLLLSSVIHVAKVRMVR
jgi:hypothetical protein